MSLLNKVCPLLRCVFFANFFLGVSGSCLYASVFVGQDGVDQTKNLPSAILGQNMDIHLMDGEERQRIVLPETNIQKAVVSQGDMLFLVPQDVWTHILSFVSYNDRLQFSLASRDLSFVGRKALMKHDLRCLEKRQWTGGLAADTFDNYLFNNILWTMGSQYLNSCSSWCQDPWACARVFMKEVNFLQGNFSQCSTLTDAIFGALI